ncbi:DUF4440 domain-containing protein [Streptomyces sp. NPDC053367]|uniref:nuclear transport factor 2 family protein n=1 Tax=Streptomyces sp. NPDC053367 TaxID=3365700 RepID=UPI0037CEDD07
MTDDEDHIAEAIAGELRLMDPAVRTSAEETARLLDPRFVEVGASGRRWTYEAMLAALPGMAGSAAEGPRYEPSDIEGVLLGPGVVHLTYETVLDGRRARRSSIWCRGEGGEGWRLYYHQATPVPEGAARVPAPAVPA